MNTVSWRIQHDHIWFFFQVVQNFQHISCNKSAIGQVHSARHSLWLLLLHLLQSPHRSLLLPPVPRSWQIVPVPLYRSNTSIPLVFWMYSRTTEYKTSAANGVRLEERKCTDTEFQSQQSLIKIILSIKNPCLVTLNHI